MPPSHQKCTNIASKKKHIVASNASVAWLTWSLNCFACIQVQLSWMAPLCIHYPYSCQLINKQLIYTQGGQHSPSMHMCHHTQKANQPECDSVFKVELICALELGHKWFLHILCSLPCIVPAAIQPLLRCCNEYRTVMVGKMNP